LSAGCLLPPSKMPQPPKGTGKITERPAEDFVAYLNRHRPGDILLSSNIARGFDLASQWPEMQAEAAQENATPEGSCP